MPCTSGSYREDGFIQQFKRGPESHHSHHSTPMSLSPVPEVNATLKRRIAALEEENTQLLSKMIKTLYVVDHYIQADLPSEF
jgi:hypothetical protein